MEKGTENISYYNNNSSDKITDIDLMKMALENQKLKKGLNIIINKIDIIYDNIFDYFNNDTLEFTLHDDIIYFHKNILKLYQMQLIKIYEKWLLNEKDESTLVNYLNLLINVNDAIEHNDILKNQSN